MELHGCENEEGGEGFLYLMITYNTWVYTISATGFGDMGPIHRSSVRVGGNPNFDSHTSVI